MANIVNIFKQTYIDYAKIKRSKKFTNFFSSFYSVIIKGIYSFKVNYFIKKILFFINNLINIY